MMSWPTLIVSNSKSKGYKQKKNKKFVLNSQLKPYKILANDVQVIILCLSYFITFVPMYQILLWRNIPKASIVELETEEIAEQATGQSKQRARKGPE